jgi:hypothetical protein
VLKDGQFKDGDKLVAVTLDVAGSYRLPMVFQYWMAEVARDHLRLGVYFGAMAIMLQIPGAAGYEWVADDDLGDAAYTLTRASDRNTLLNVLAVCLERLRAKELIEQVPAGDYYEEELPRKWKSLLNKLGKMENGLLTVVAQCLDALVVEPGLAEIEKAAEQPWWHRWRVREV